MTLLLLISFSRALWFWSYFSRFNSLLLLRVVLRGVRAKIVRCGVLGSLITQS